MEQSHRLGRALRFLALAQILAAVIALAFVGREGLLLLLLVGIDLAGFFASRAIFRWVRAALRRPTVSSAVQRFSGWLPKVAMGVGFSFGALFLLYLILVALANDHVGADLVLSVLITFGLGFSGLALAGLNVLCRSDSLSGWQRKLVSALRLTIQTVLSVVLGVFILALIVAIGALGSGQ